MAEASGRAARSAATRRPPNALFVAAAAEALPAELDRHRRPRRHPAAVGLAAARRAGPRRGRRPRHRRPRRARRPGRDPRGAGREGPPRAGRRRRGTTRERPRRRLADGSASSCSTPRRPPTRTSPRARSTWARRLGGSGRTTRIARAYRLRLRRPERRSALISSGHVRRPRTVRRDRAADPDRGRRPQPARHPRRSAPHGRLPGDDRPRRRRGAATPVAVLARPPDHRHADAADGRPDARARGQGTRRPADHRAVGDRHRGLEGRPARRGRRGLHHQALPLPRAAGADHAGAAPARRPGAAPAPGDRARTSRSSSTAGRPSSPAIPCR